MASNSRSMSLCSPSSPDFLRQLKTLLDVREGNTRDGGQKFVTMAELADMGLTSGGYNDVGVWDGTKQKTGDTTPPHAPTNLQIKNNVITHILSWKNPTDEDFMHIEVWQANTQDRTTAKLVTIATKPTEAVTIGGVGPRDNYYYWIRAVDTSGNYSPWCPNEQMGGELVAGEFAESINTLLGKLTDDDRYENIHTIVADSFRIIEPSAGLTEGKKVFSTGNIDGKPTVGISGDLIVDGAVLSRMIAAEAVTADKVSATDTFTMTLQSNNYAPNSSGFRIDAASGTAEFNAMKFKFQSGATIPSEIDNGVVRQELLTNEQQLRNEISYAQSAMNSKLNGAINDWNTTTISGGRIQTGTLTANAVGTNQICAYSANIKNGIINDAHIGNLSANKITTGVLDATLIRAGSIETDHIASGSVSAVFFTEGHQSVSSVITLKRSTLVLFTGGCYNHKDGYTYLYVNGGHAHSVWGEGGTWCCIDKGVWLSAGSHSVTLAGHANTHHVALLGLAIYK